MKTATWRVGGQVAQTELGRGRGVSAESLFRNQREGRWGDLGGCGLRLSPGGLGVGVGLRLLL